ncbi:hypothetical protein BV378_01330 [Nostoc sp. RF31YmG]|nr:hypothetical protein BV378_01330 [Nostoc sp. RF31YmG]
MKTQVNPSQKAIKSQRSAIAELNLPLIPKPHFQSEPEQGVAFHTDSYSFANTRINVQPFESLKTSSNQGGKPMPDGIQQKMESAFGTSFSEVRVHEGAEAAALGAEAYTYRSHIHFAPGKFDPSSQSGQALLAHELTHVMQQRAAEKSVQQNEDFLINLDSNLEAEADQTGDKAAQGQAVQVTGAGLGVQMGRGYKGTGKLVDFFEEKAKEAKETPRRTRTGDYLTTMMDPRDRGEHERAGFDGTYYKVDPDAPKTQIAPNSYQLGIDKGVVKPAWASIGELKQIYGQTATRTANKKLDTLAARRVVSTPDSKHGRYIFVMDASGEFYAVDEGAERMKREQKVHHSTLLSGEDVAGAGEIQIRDGKVEVITDQSGHYQPSIVQTHQVVKSLQKKGVALESVGVELAGKGDYSDVVNLSALELEAYEPEMKQAREKYEDWKAQNASATDQEKYKQGKQILGEPEQKIREAHSKKSNLLLELRAKTKQRKLLLDKEAEKTTGTGTRQENYDPQALQKYAAATQMDQTWLRKIITNVETPDLSDVLAMKLAPESIRKAAEQAEIAHSDIAAELAGKLGTNKDNFGQKTLLATLRSNLAAQGLRKEGPALEGKENVWERNRHEGGIVPGLMELLVPKDRQIALKKWQKRTGDLELGYLLSDADFK